MNRTPQIGDVLRVHYVDTSKTPDPATGIPRAALVTGVSIDDDGETHVTARVFGDDGSDDVAEIVPAPDQLDDETPTITAAYVYMPR